MPLGLYNATEMDPNSKTIALILTCSELDNKLNYQARSVTERVAETGSYLVAGATGLAASAFSVLNGSDVQREFMAKLNEIKLTLNRIERIRQVYQLVSKFEGLFDNDS